MTEANPNNGNKSKSDIFHGTYSHLTPHFALSKNIKVFPSFMTKVKPSNRNETKPDIFPWDIFNLISFFLDHKKLKYFNEFYTWDLLLSLQR